MKIEINEQFQRALTLLEKGGRNIFITGKAGTGKSTLLEYFRANFKQNLAVLAPTGVAALNVNGQTVHSFFHFSTSVTPETALKKKPSKQLQQMICSLDAMIIDEVSMLRADLLDCMDRVMRFCTEDSRPFGGIKMVFIGDLYQLPPVVASAEERELFKSYYASPYFFDAKACEGLALDCVELKKVYRQEEEDFIHLLNKIRDKSVNADDMDILNSRHLPHYVESDSGDGLSITLTPTNRAADDVNFEKLEGLMTRAETFYAELSGDFDSKHMPTSAKLELKIGAQIMLLNNDSGGRWVNGSVGRILDIGFDEYEGDDVLTVQLQGGKKVSVGRHKWELNRYFFNEQKGVLDSESVGSFTQYPVRLAWAVTIHKSQGKTFDRVIFDIGRGAFAHGQVYVALSRCRSFQGLVLKKPISERHIWKDFRVQSFMRQMLGRG